MTIFGAIKVASDLEEAVIRTLEKWFPVYLKEYELAAGLIPNPSASDVLPLPKSWLRANEIDREAADILPSVIVVSPGLSPRNSPRQEGDGSFRVFFSVGIGIFASSKTRKETLDLVRIYTAIIRTIMLQQQSMEGFADGSKWLDESYDDNFPFVDNQTISAGQVVFEIEVAGIVTRYGGPALYQQSQPLPDPLTQPGSNWPPAEHITVSVNGRSETYSQALEEEDMIVATTVAGLGRPDENGTWGTVVVGTYPNETRITLQWDKPHNLWVGDPITILTLVDQYGMRLNDAANLTLWQYFYAPVYFAGTDHGGWGAMIDPLDSVDVLYAAGLHLEERIGSLMNGNGVQPMSIAAYYTAFSPGDKPNAYAATGGLGFGNVLVGPIPTFLDQGAASGERGMEWRPDPDPGWQSLPIVTPTKPKLRASLFGKMPVGTASGANQSGEISDTKVELRWVGQL